MNSEAYFFALVFGVIVNVSAEPEGIIGKVVEDGKTILYSFDNYLPSEDVMQGFPALVVMTWKYDGSKNKGMPSSSELEVIYSFESVLDDLAEQGASFRAYARTGNNVREFVYYTVSQDFYLEALNKALAEHPAYPIEITFYSDPEWSDYKKLMTDFKANH